MSVRQLCALWPLEVPTSLTYQSLTSQKSHLTRLSPPISSLSCHLRSSPPGEQLSLPHPPGLVPLPLSPGCSAALGEWAASPAGMPLPSLCVRVCHLLWLLPAFLLTLLYLPQGFLPATLRSLDVRVPGLCYRAFPSPPLLCTPQAASDSPGIDTLISSLHLFSELCIQRPSCLGAFQLSGCPTSISKSSCLKD